VADTVATGLLCFVKKFIYRIDEIDKIDDAGFHVDTGAHADGHIDLVSFQRDRGGGNFLADSIGNLDGKIEVGVREDDRKNLATVTTHNIGGSHFSTADIRQLLEHQVAGLVAMAIVDALEMVDINKHQAGGRAAALGAIQFVLQYGLEMAIVKQAG